MDRSQDAATSVHGRDRLNMIGGLGGGTGLRFRASAKVIADGGRLDTYPERILVENATTATIGTDRGHKLSGRRSGSRG